MADKRFDLNPLALLAVVLGGVLIGIGIVQLWPPSWPGEGPATVRADEVPMVYTTRDIEAGTILEASMLKLRAVPEEEAIDHWIGDEEMIIGLKTRVDIREGQPVSTDQIVPPDDVQ